MSIVIPITLKQLPKLIGGLLSREFVLRKNPDSPTTFHLCFFSCSSYFNYLICSLHSLKRQQGEFKFKVYVFSDLDQPFEEAQVEKIRKLFPEAEVIPWPKSMGWGGEQISNIWNAYKYVAEQANEMDIIARVDSDVFFFNDRIFHMVSATDADLIGDGHFIGFRYVQGGCYFFRVSAVREICDEIHSHGMENLLKAGKINVEDAAAYYFSRRLKQRVWMTWFMMFPDEYKNSGGLSWSARFKFSCLHFVMKNKQAMLDVYLTEQLENDSLELSEFKAILD